MSTADGSSVGDEIPALPSNNEEQHDHEEEETAHVGNVDDLDFSQNKPFGVEVTDTDTGNGVDEMLPSGGSTPSTANSKEGQKSKKRALVETPPDGSFSNTNQSSQLASSGENNSSGALKSKKSMRVKKLKDEQHENGGKQLAGQFSKANEYFFQTVVDTFQQFDKDNTGSIDKEELGLCLKSMGYELGPTQLEGLLEQVDVDGGGTLDLSEFTTLLKLWMEAAQFKVLGGSDEVVTDHIFSSVLTKVPTWLPDAPWKWLWDLAYLVVATYFWISVAGSWAFDDGEARKLYRRLILVPDIVGTIFLFLDIALKFNVAKITPTGSFMGTRGDIAKYYLVTWFIVDLLAAIPFRLFIEAASSEEDLQGQRVGGANVASLVLQHFRLLCAVRIPFLFETSGLVTINSLYIKFHYSFLPYVYMTAGFAALTFTCAAVEHQLRIIDINEGRMEQVEHRFAASFYWVLYCLTSVGYGDRGAQFTEHQWFAIILFTLSILINGLFIGKMVELMQEANVEEMRKNKLATTQAVLTAFEVPEGLAYEIMQFQNHVLQHDVSNSFAQVVSNLPQEMQFNIVMQSRVPLLADIHIFRSTHISTLIQLAGEMFSIFWWPGEPVLVCGQYNDTMFVVSYGFLDVVDPSGELQKTLTRGGYFGERGMLTGGSRCYHNVKSLTYCELWAITNETLDDVGRRIPKFGKEMNTLKFIADESIPTPAQEVVDKFFKDLDKKDEDAGIVSVAKQQEIEMGISTIGGVSFLGGDASINSGGLMRVGTLSQLTTGGGATGGGGLARVGTLGAMTRGGGARVKSVSVNSSVVTNSAEGLSLLSPNGPTTRGRRASALVTTSPLSLKPGGDNFAVARHLSDDSTNSAEHPSWLLNETTDTEQPTPSRRHRPGHEALDSHSARTEGKVEDHLFELIEEESTEVSRLTEILAKINNRLLTEDGQMAIIGRSRSSSLVNNTNNTTKMPSTDPLTVPQPSDADGFVVSTAGDEGSSQPEILENGDTSSSTGSKGAIAPATINISIDVSDQEVEAEVRRLFRKDPVLASLLE